MSRNYEGEKVEIVAPNSKYRGEIGTIGYSTRGSFMVRLQKKRPIEERLSFSKSGVVMSASGPNRLILVRKNSVRLLGKKIKINLNDYMGPTSKLFNKTYGKTREQVRFMIKSGKI
jgi:hypothetical protein